MGGWATGDCAGAEPTWLLIEEQADGQIKYAFGNLTASTSRLRALPRWRKTPHGSGPRKVRGVVERTIGWLKGLRRRRARYGRLGMIMHPGPPSRRMSPASG